MTKDTDPNDQQKQHPPKWEYYLIETDDGSLVRVPADKLDSWLKTQDEIRNGTYKVPQEDIDKLIAAFHSNRNKASMEATAETKERIHATFNKPTQQPPPPPQKQPKKHSQTFWALLLFLILSLVAAFFFLLKGNFEYAEAHKKLTDELQAVKAENALLKGAEKDKTSPSTPAPSVYRPLNGAVYKKPTYYCVAPLKVTADSDSDVYVYLKYIAIPTDTQLNRKTSPNATVLTSDLTFYVRAGETAEVDVPIGVYELYYACGTDWTGTKDKFGENTAYYISDDRFSFTYKDGYYNGHTIKLYPVTNGNLDTHEIDATDFP